MKSVTLVLSLGMLLAAPAGAAQGSDSAGKAEGGLATTTLYPEESLKLREEGIVHYRIELSRKGELESCTVTRSSGYARLDAATCVLLVRQARFKPQLNKNGKPIRSSYDGKIVWKLPT